MAGKGVGDAVCVGDVESGDLTPVGAAGVGAGDVDVEVADGLVRGAAVVLPDGDPGRVVSRGDGPGRVADSAQERV